MLSPIALSSDLFVLKSSNNSQTYGFAHDIFSTSCTMPPSNMLPYASYQFPIWKLFSDLIPRFHKTFCFSSKVHEYLPDLLNYFYNCKSEIENINISLAGVWFGYGYCYCLSSDSIKSTALLRPDVSFVS